MLGIMPWRNMRILFRFESKPESKLMVEPLRDKPISLATLANDSKQEGNNNISLTLTDAVMGLVNRNPLLSTMFTDFSPVWCLCPEYPTMSPLF
jgi:hypothetical protein